MINELKTALQNWLDKGKKWENAMDKLEADPLNKLLEEDERQAYIEDHKAFKKFMKIFSEVTDIDEKTLRSMMISDQTKTLALIEKLK